MKILKSIKTSNLLIYVSLGTTLFITNISQTKAVITLSKIEGVPTKSINDILNDTIKWVLGFGITIAVTFLVWGGLVYVTSSGDTTKAENAKKTVKYSLLGILVIGLSYAAIAMLDKIFK